MDPVHSSFGFSESQFVPLELLSTITRYNLCLNAVWLFVLNYCTAHNWIFCRRRVLRRVTKLSEPCHVWHIPPSLLLIVSFFLFPNILQIFSYNGSFQHIQTLLHLRILKIEWVRGWKESLFVKGGGEGTLDSIAVSIFIDWLSWQILYQKPRSK